MDKDLWELYGKYCEELQDLRRSKDQWMPVMVEHMRRFVEMSDESEELEEKIKALVERLNQCGGEGCT